MSEERWAAETLALLGNADFLWHAALGLAALIVLAYAAVFARRNRRDARRLEEAVRLGLDRPVAQYPFIDAARCIGCAACVRACPEGDVLGIVGGTAVVINGLRCVGLAHCEAACGVEAIEVGLGPIRERQDVPLLGAGGETSVPGIHVAGELGGLALVRNAVEEGRAVVEKLAHDVEISKASGDELDLDLDLDLDLAIVGAGPAGISAALAAVQAGWRARIFEQADSLGGALLHYPRRKLVLTEPVEFAGGARLTRREYSKEELLAFFGELVERHPLDLRFSAKVEKIEPLGAAGFRLASRAGEARARRVLLALGRRGTPRRLGVPGEELPKVIYQLRDADSFEHRRVLVVGGGDSAVEAALGLVRSGVGNRVTLSYRREKFVRTKRKNQLAVDKAARRGRLRVLFSSRVVEIRPQSVVLEIDDAESGARHEELPNDDVLVLIGGEPPLALPRQLGIRFGGPPTQG